MTRTKFDRTKLLRLMVFLVFAVSLLAMQLYERSFRLYSDGASILDMRFHYSPADVYRLFDALGTSGRLIYTRILMIDFAFIASFALLQIMIMKTIMGQELLKSGFRRLMVLPYLRGFADIVEDISLFILLKSFPAIKPQLANISSLITTLKFIFLALWIISILLIVLIKNRQKQKGLKQ